MTFRVPLVLAFVVVALVPAGTAVASDQPTILYPEHQERTVSPGETIEIRMFVDSDGGFQDVGIAHLTMNASFETENLRATSVETASYFEQGDSTDVYNKTAVDNQDGVVVAEQWREPERNGSTGTARFATVTFKISEDAPETNTTITFENSTAQLVDDYDVLVYEHNATLRIDDDAGSQRNASAGKTADGDASEADSVGTETLLASLAGVVLFVGLAAVLRQRK
ncbi:cohesin domain-containing protein [Halovenus rubra]|uniref:Cohesin domain-containing protein n=2 Tax=Halovenus rubra TaxID=869890 RepID=A0ABD5XCX9_9EURY|nr:cohesin domain-containing protein [Halovenus rubra]